LDLGFNSTVPVLKLSQSMKGETLPVAVLSTEDAPNPAFVAFDEDGEYLKTALQESVSVFRRNHFYGFRYISDDTLLVKWDVNFSEVASKKLGSTFCTDTKLFSGLQFILSFFGSFSNGFLQDDKLLLYSRNELMLIDEDLNIVFHDTIISKPSRAKLSANSAIVAGTFSQNFILSSG
jgi:hypothetical protein